MTTKVEMAREILNKNKGKARKEIIALFMKDAELSHNAASTYYYNLTKGTEKKAKAVEKTMKAVNVLKTAEKAVKSATTAARKATAPKKTAKVKETANGADKDFVPYEIPATGETINLNEIPLFLRK